MFVDETEKYGSKTKSIGMIYKKAINMLLTWQLIQIRSAHRRNRRAVRVFAIRQLIANRLQHICYFVPHRDTFERTHQPKYFLDEQIMVMQIRTFAAMQRYLKKR